MKDKIIRLSQKLSRWLGSGLTGDHSLASPSSRPDPTPPGEDKTQWLFRQLPQWVDSGLIDNQTAEAIRQKYQNETGPDSVQANWVTSLATIAAAMVGVGLIMLIAWNWNDLARPVGAVLALALWLVPSSLLVWVVFSARPARPYGWTEGAAVLQNLCTGGALTLIDNLYPNIGESFSLLLLWMLMQLPLLYLIRANYSLLIYLVVALLYSASGPDIGWFWALMLLTLPVLYLTRSRLATVAYLLPIYIQLVQIQYPISADPSGYVSSLLETAGFMYWVFLGPWLLLVYAHRSLIVSMFYPLFLVVGFEFADDFEILHRVAFWIFLFLWLPHLLAYLRAPDQENPRLMFCQLWFSTAVICFGFGWELVHQEAAQDGARFNLIALALFCSILVGLGRAVSSRYGSFFGSEFRWRPLELCGGMGVVLVSLFLSVESGWSNQEGASSLLGVGESHGYFFLAVLLTVWALLSYQRIRARDLQITPFMAFPAVLLSIIALFDFLGVITATWLFNIYLTFGICIWWIIEGALRLNPVLLYTSALVVVAQPIVRLDYKDFDILPLATVLIFSGLGILAVNWFLRKKRQQAI